MTANSNKMEVDYVIKRDGAQEETSFEKILNRIKKDSIYFNITKLPIFYW